MTKSPLVKLNRGQIMEYGQKTDVASLHQAMQIIADNYFFARNVLIKRIELSDDNFNVLICYIQRVRIAFDSLNLTEKNFLNNEYFYEAFPKWWKSKITYYRYIQLKAQSIKHFLEVFYVSF